MGTLLRLLAIVLLAACAQTPASTPSDAEVGVATEALTTTNIVPEADTTLRLAVPFGNDGTGARLGVSSASVADLERTLIRFPSAQINAAVSGGEVLHKAEIELTVDTLSVGWAGGRIEILPMNRTWPEGNGLAGNGPSWVCANDTNTTLFGNAVNNCTAANDWGMLPTDPRPLPFETDATDSIALFTGGPRKVRLDVTADVQKILNGTMDNHGWLLKGQASTWAGQLVNFRSGETAEPPLLIIEAGTDECLSDPNKGVPGVCDCGTPDRDINGDGAPDCFDAIINATADTTVRQAIPFGNDGTGQLLGVTSASIAALERSLVRVDQPAIAAVVGGRVVTEAYLELSIAGMSLNWLGGAIELRQMTKDWPEGTGTVTGGFGPSWVCANDTNTSAFGNLFDNCTPANRWGMQPWDLSPRPYVPTPTDTLPLQIFGTGTVRFDVTGDVQAFLSGAVNRGWIVMGTVDLISGEYVNFGSRESGAPPRLLLKFEEGCEDDPNKSTPGACGCGVPDTDTDVDTVPDCIDDCPLDDQKQSPGVCGCGVSDIDGDGDSVPDCEDECPADSTKSRAGDCGCADAPFPPGTPCNDGVCPGCYACDGAGICGDPEACSPDAGQCTYTEFRGRTYWVCGPEEWNQANERCRDGNGSLVRIDEVGEDSFLAGLVNGRSWIGANDSGAELWVWTSFSGVDSPAFWEGGADGVRRNTLYGNWATGEPAAPGTCGSIDPAGGWHAQPCGDALPYVCEMPGGESGVAQCVDPVDRCTFRPGLTCPSAVPPLDPNCTPVAQVDDILADLQRCQAAGCAQSDAACLAANCTGAAAPPTGNSCEPVSNEEARNCALAPLPMGCTLANLATCCTDPSHCGYCDADNDCDTANGYMCNRDYDCAHTVCDNAGNCTAAPAGTDCRGVLRCGLPVDTCLANDFGALCDTLSTCPIFTATEDDANPTLDPGTTFGPGIPPEYVPSFPPEKLPASPEYDQSCEELGNCPFPPGERHDWCDYDVEDTLDSHGETQADQGHSGSGSLVSFDFAPDLWMDYGATPGPLGLTEFALDAGARFEASTTFRLPVVPQFTFELLNLEMSAQADPCNFTTRNSKLRVLQSDLLPELLDFLYAEGLSPIDSDDFPFDYPVDPDATKPGNQAVDACRDAYADFVEAVDRAKKALKDAQWLITKYEEALAASRHFDPKLLCEEVQAHVGPRGFPSIDCDNPGITAVQVINTYVDYYRGFAMDEVRSKALAFAGKAKLEYALPFGMGYPDGGVQESELIARVPFSIGPIPMLLEVEAFMQYGISGKVHVGATMEGIMQAVLASSDATAEVAYAGASVEPFAGAGIGLFVGVGFDFGLAGASAGVEGQLTLADLSLPIFARAGIEVGTENTERTATPALAAVQGEGQDLIRSRKYRYAFTYAVGAGIRIENILRGRINARARIKVLFFSKTWRVTILEFPGFCKYDGGTHNPDCYFPLITEGGTFEGRTPALPWGTVEMPMPFISMKHLDALAPPMGATIEPAATARVPNGEYFYDRDCQCIAPNLPVETEPEDRCTRNEDCCPGALDRCFTTPETGLNDCVECRTGNESCYEDSDCCGDMQCFKAPDDFSSAPPVCIFYVNIGFTCNETEECAPDADLGCWDDPNPAGFTYTRCTDTRQLDDSCQATSDCVNTATLGCWNDPFRSYDICTDGRSCGESCNTNSDCAGYSASDLDTPRCRQNRCQQSAFWSGCGPR